MKIFIAYIVFTILLVLYSYTQIDLGLTIARSELLQQMIRGFQEIGYFQRPLAASLFALLLVGMYAFYIVFLVRVWQKKISLRSLWKIFFVTAGILFFSYNAFSHDLFNYIFDAKIVTYYHQNPYEHKALDFPNDPMLSFMHWTHRVYPYGPVWLGITVPLSFVGFSYFLPTLFLFKGLMVGSFLGCLYFIHKIMQKITPQKEAIALAFFGLQPLILIEALISAHLDIVMVCMGLAAFWFLIEKRYLWAFLLLFLSIGVKFATVFLLPIVIVVWIWDKQKKKMRWEKILYASLLLMTLAVAAMAWSRELYPWYLISALSFAALLSWRFSILIASSALSFFILLIYLPYLYLGTWDPPVPQVRLWIYIVGFVCALVGGYIGMLLDKKYQTTER
ncbi:MAG: hypothetical protein AAB553_00410 [Patescibacteria group bacterium]